MAKNPPPGSPFILILSAAEIWKYLDISDVVNRCQYPLLRANFGSFDVEAGSVPLANGAVDIILPSTSVKLSSL